MSDQFTPESNHGDENEILVPNVAGLLNEYDADPNSSLDIRIVAEDLADLVSEEHLRFEGRLPMVRIADHLNNQMSFEAKELEKEIERTPKSVIGLQDTRIWDLVSKLNKAGIKIPPESTAILMAKGRLYRSEMAYLQFTDPSWETMTIELGLERLMRIFQNKLLAFEPDLTEPHRRAIFDIWGIEEFNGHEDELK